MVNGEKFENPASNNADHLKEETGKNLLADAQIAQPPRPVDKAPNAPDAPAERVAAADQTAPVGDMSAAKVADLVANIKDSAGTKMAALSSPEGQKLLNQEHACGMSTKQQWLADYPLACEKANIT